MKIYTKTGDQGETSLYGGQRVDKDHLRIDTFGTVDELNATLGVVRAELARLPEKFTAIDEVLGHAQNHLFDLGAELATPDAAKKGTQLLNSAATQILETAIDHWDAQLPPLVQFILPGGTELAARLHVSRCVCRRAERALVTLTRAESIRPELTVYLNRLSDLLFVLARAANHLSGVGDVAWKKSDV